MPVDRSLDERLAAADPVTVGEASGWSASPAGQAVFDDVQRAAALSDSGDIGARSRRRWPRRLALAGVAAVSVAALGVSLAVALEQSRDGGDVAGPGYFVMGDGPPGAALVEPGSESEPWIAASPSPGGPSEFRVAGSAPGAASGAPAADEHLGPVRRVIRSGGGGGGGGGAGGEDSDPAGAVSEPALGRGLESRIVKTARLEIAVDERGLDRARADVSAMVDRAGGFVESSERSPRSASLTVRVPADRFEETLTEVEQLGEVRQQSVSGDDVSGDLVDLEARLRHWQAQESVLLGLMDEATTVAESIEVRRELAPVQETIERIEGRLRVLEDDVEFSTADLFLFDPDVEAPDTRDRDDPGWFEDVWDDALRLGRGIVRGTAVALGALVPIAALWVAPVLGVVWLRRRRREAAIGG